MCLSLDCWGPVFWTTLHVIAHTRPIQLSEPEQSELLQLLVLIGKHLPCPLCRQHFLTFLEQRAMSPALSTRASVVALLNDAHNDVNRRRAKRVFTLGEHYRAFHALENRDHVARIVPQVTLTIVLCTAVGIVVYVSSTGKLQRVVGMLVEQTAHKQASLPQGAVVTDSLV